MPNREETITIPSTRLQCRHILPAGRRCRSACLRGEPFCYFHHNTRKPIPPAELESRKGRRSSFHLPLPEDRAAIGHAIGLIVQRIAANTLDPRRAGLLLYGLQTAALALPKEPAQPLPIPQDDDREPDTVEVQDLIEDPTHGLLAPEVSMPATRRRKSLEEILLSDWESDEVDEENDNSGDELSVLSTLQAAAPPASTLPGANAVSQKTCALPSADALAVLLSHSGNARNAAFLPTSLQGRLTESFGLFGRPKPNYAISAHKTTAGTAVLGRPCIAHGIEDLAHIVLACPAILDPAQKITTHHSEHPVDDMKKLLTG